MMHNLKTLLSFATHSIGSDIVCLTATWILILPISFSPNKYYRL